MDKTEVGASSSLDVIVLSGSRETCLASHRACSLTLPSSSYSLGQTITCVKSQLSSWLDNPLPVPLHSWWIWGLLVASPGPRSGTRCQLRVSWASRMEVAPWIVTRVVVTGLLALCHVARPAQAGLASSCGLANISEGRSTHWGSPEAWASELTQ